MPYNYKLPKNGALPARADYAVAVFNSPSELICFRRSEVDAARLFLLERGFSASSRIVEDAEWSVIKAELEHFEEKCEGQRHLNIKCYPKDGKKSTARKLRFDYSCAGKKCPGNASCVVVEVDIGVVECRPQPN